MESALIFPRVLFPSTLFTEHHPLCQMDTPVRAALPSGCPWGRGHSVQQDELYHSPAGKLFLDVFKGTVHTVARGDPWSSLSQADPGASQGPHSLHMAPPSLVMPSAPRPTPSLDRSTPHWEDTPLPRQPFRPPWSGGQASPSGAASSCVHPTRQIGAALHGNYSVISFPPPKHELWRRQGGARFLWLSLQTLANSQLGG